MTDWLRVTEHPPPTDEDVEVLAVFKASNGERFISSAETDDGKLYEIGEGRYWLSDVIGTHWMPLPELPKEGR